HGLGTFLLWKTSSTTKCVRVREHAFLAARHLVLCLELVSLGEFLVAGEGGGQGQEAAEEVSVAFVAGGQAAVAEQPRHRALDDPAVPAELVGGVDALAGNPRDDAAPAQPHPQRGEVVGLVGMELGRPETPRATAGPDG